MKNGIGLVIAGCIAGGLLTGCGVMNDLTGGTRTADLRTDWAVEPVGVDNAPSFSWKMLSFRTGASQQAYQVRVWEGKILKWDSGVVKSDKSVGIQYQGSALKPAMKYVWDVKVQDGRGKWLAAEKAGFETGLLTPDGWKGSEWISPAKKGAVDSAAFRKTFRNAKAVADAKWFVTGLGVFDAYVNGKPVSRILPSGREVRDVLKPGLTQRNRCRHYFTYDVTRQMNCAANAENVFAAIVTGGWWRDAIVSNYGKESAFRAVLLVRYADGTEARFGTGTNWMAAHAGPVVQASIYDGEVYDARMGTDWLRGGTLGAEWEPAVINTEFAGEIRSLQGPSIRVRDDLELTPKQVYVIKGATGADNDKFGVATIVRRYADGEKFVVNPGEELVVDLGQNAAGWPCFTVSGAEGTVLTIRHAEMLNDKEGIKKRGNDGPEGSPYVANLRGIRASIVYTLAGRESETYHPGFSFFGYRYLGIKTTQPVTFSKIRGQVVTSIPYGGDLGRLVTDNSLVNQLYSNVRWGQYSNYLSVPTDCPQRNERMGWTADTQVFSTAAAYNAMVYGFLSKWMGDMRDDQLENGAYPSVAPYSAYGQEGAVTGWADAGVIVPYNMYKMFGDAAILRDNWASMERYMAHIAEHNGPDRQNYGDWLAYERNDMDIKMYLAASYYVWDSKMMKEMAAALGKPDAVAKYTAMEQKARDFFRGRYLNADGTIQQKYRCQTASIFALYLDVNEGAAKAATLDDLVNNIKAHGDKLQTGFLGTSILMDTLTKMGRTDVAYTLLLQRGNPSWLYSVDQGATTIWERWNSYVKETGFGDVGMNSFNHYAYGAVASWMYSTMAGIGYDVTNPGFKNILLAPKPDSRIGKVNCSYESAYGTIVSKWVFDGGTWKYEAKTPANTSATLTLPPAKAITVNGKAPEALTLDRNGLALVDTAKDGSRTFRVAGSTTVKAVLTF
jgi:hypothetical protein